MSRLGTVLMLSVLWVIACAHTQQTEDEADQGGAKKEKKERHGKPPSDPTAVKRGRHSEVKRPAYAGRPELATNAAGLMKPEGPMRIQKKLADQGYYQGEVTGALDEKTQEALRKFQAEHDLARTGAPDQETLKALGLSPDEIFRSQQKREKEEQKAREEKTEAKELKQEN